MASPGLFVSQQQSNVDLSTTIATLSMHPTLINVRPHKEKGGNPAGWLVFSQWLTVIITPVKVLA